MKIILGTGIAGLIASYCHPDFFAIGDQIGGQMNAPFDLGPRYLHKSSEKIVNFLKELDVDFEEKTIKIGYLDDFGFVEKPTQKFREKYFMKSRGQTTLDGFDPSVMNSNKNSFDILRINFKDLVFKLYTKVSDRIYEGVITGIDLEKSLVHVDNAQCNMHFKYSKLISTIPLNIFSKVACLNLDLQSYDMSYGLFRDFNVDFRDYDYIYDCRSYTPYHRMTYTNKGVVVDFLSLNINKFTLKPDEMVSLKNSQIISLKRAFELDNVRFVGRYAKWDRKIKTETLIEELSNEQGNLG